ncbi:MAG TPA: glycoside hydrolase family 3 N-terminal domain-containing protein [Longimicrobiales bacterium]|nr:glycoside hydrolase family 3 N-terminal domain-containing protein [Longimicrobiales bacterium]
MTARLRCYLGAVVLAIMSACATTAPPVSAPAQASVESAFVDSVLALMTPEEKVGQLNQFNGAWDQAGPNVPDSIYAAIRAGRVGSLIGVFGAGLTRSVQQAAVEQSRLRIPLLLAHDVIHGFRTIFPVPIGEASSWDVAAVERSARIAAIEATAHGLNWTYAPMVDIARDPRWGRIVEGAGEDPYLGAQMAAARVRGFQGNDLTAANTMMATAKHFVAYGSAEGGRDYNVADISERTLHEIYLPPFEAAVRAGAASVMASFNEIAGIPMHAHGRLLNDLLRGKWRFDGVVISDWTGIMEMLRHGVAADTAQAAALAINAGVDIDMMAAFYLKQLPALIRTGRVPQSVVDDAVRRVLRAKYRLGLFHDPYRYNDEQRQRTLTLHADHMAFARDIARRSIVLLKNERNVLPLAKNLGSIVVIGSLATDTRSALGNWSAAGREPDVVSALDGIRRAVSPSTKVIYAKGAVVEGNDTTGFAEALTAARAADVIIAIVGENQDMSAEARNRTSLELPGTQLLLLQRLQTLDKPLVAVLSNGRPLAIPWLAANVPAILESWFLGVQTGPALADVLFGDYNPSGKLPVTFPHNVGQVPIYYNHKNTGRPPLESDRYTSKYIDAPWTPQYVFGHGLSYTTFGYSAPRLSRDSMGTTDTLTVEVSVTNTGTRSGTEIVQLYLRDDVASVTRPVRALRGFRKVQLDAGAATTVRFTLTPDDLALLDAQLEPVVEAGTFTVFVGGSSATTNQARFRVFD